MASPVGPQCITARNIEEEVREFRDKSSKVINCFRCFGRGFVHDHHVAHQRSHHSHSSEKYNCKTNSVLLFPWERCDLCLDCPLCEGRGRIKVYGKKVCEECGGRGSRRHERHINPIGTVRCRRCLSCRYCKGSGLITMDTVDVAREKHKKRAIDMKARVE